MQSLLNIFKSRTNWVIIITFALNAVQYLAPFVPADSLLLINSILSALAVYFRINPRAQF